MGILDRFRDRFAGAKAPDRAQPAVAEPQGEAVANGWTRKEAEAMEAHIGTKYTREHPEPSAAATRQAERMADPTDRMHDARREAEADAYGARSGSKEAALSADRAANARAPSPLDARDAEGISARDRINDALKSVDAYKQARGPGEVPPFTISPEFKHRAAEDVSAAWDDPAAAKAMRAAGADRIAMMDDVGRGKLDGVRQALSAAGAKPGAEHIPDNRDFARDFWKQVAAAAPPEAKIAQADKQAVRAGNRA